MHLPEIIRCMLLHMLAVVELNLTGSYWHDGTAVVISSCRGHGFGELNERQR